LYVELASTSSRNHSKSHSFRVAVLPMSKQPYPSELADRFQLRMPQQIAQIAEANGRSMNTEIVLRLQQSLDAPLPVMTPEVFERLFGGLLTRVEKIERKLEP
jgi:hypothetical protein